MTDYSQLSQMFGTLVLISVVFYFYLGACIMTIARKTGTPGVWMAWVPIANTLLLCRIAKRPGYWVLLMLIPFLNIILIFMVLMDVAKARGKSPALPFLLLIPLIGLAVVPLLLAIGPAVPNGSAPVQPSPSAPPSPSVKAAVPAVCPICGSTECVGEDFCGFTGKRIRPLNASASTAVPVAGVTAPQAQHQTGMFAKVLAGVIVVAVVAYFGLGLFSSARKSLFGSGQPPAVRLPVRMAGTITEFPVDTAAMPARPTSVITQNLRAPGTRTKLPPKSLPPGLPEAKLPTIADAMTSAVYQAQPADPPVNVHVLSSAPGVGPQSQQLAQGVASASGPSAQMSGVRIQSPSGGEYNGYSVRTPQTITYVLDKTGAAVIIIIYAPDPSVMETATRLAGDVGNGNGLNDDPGVSASLATLPPELPGGVELVDANTYSGASMEGSLDQLRSSVSGSFGPEAGHWVDQVQRFLPSQVTAARYLDPSRHELKLVLGDYGGTWKAWSTWQLLRVTLGLGGMHSVTMRGGDALSMVDDGTEYVLFRSRGYLGFIAGPGNGAGHSIQLAEGIGHGAENLPVARGVTEHAGPPPASRPPANTQRPVDRTPPAPVLGQNTDSAPVGAAACISSHAAEGMDGCTLRGTNLDFFGSPSAPSCKAACDGSGECVAWSWVKPNGFRQGDPPMCYRLSQMESEVYPNSCCIAGWKTRLNGEATRNR